MYTVLWLTQSPIPLIYIDAYSLIGGMKISNIWGIRGSLWACLWSKCLLCQYQLHMNCFMNKLALGWWSQKQHFSSKLIRILSSPFQWPSNWAYWAAEVWKGNTFKTAFKSKWCESVKTEQFSDILWTAAKFTKWTFFQQSSNWSYQDRLKCTKQALFHKSVYQSKALRNEHSPNSIQSELFGLSIQMGLFSKSIYGAVWTVFLWPSNWNEWNGLKCTNGTLFLHSLTATKCMIWTFFQQPSNWSDHDSLKCTKGKTFLHIFSTHLNCCCPTLSIFSQKEKKIYFHKEISCKLSLWQYACM